MICGIHLGCLLEWQAPVSRPSIYSFFTYGNFSLALPLEINQRGFFFKFTFASEKYILKSKAMSNSEPFVMIIIWNKKCFPLFSIMLKYLWCQTLLYVCDMYARAYAKWTGLWVPCDLKEKRQKPNNGKQKGRYTLIMPSLPFEKIFRHRYPIWSNP